eukprot:TRINITY_DN56922_c0_g1_i1.p1 TRINITY_DN56922_c0_g1~~TRINITY_DN56922_c0_g1_i1.p1  ORF type:complete len:355 (+),score=111.31 TRINITY_DN56922_c0_g1_i1:80-1144(+)
MDGAAEGDPGPAAAAGSPDPAGSSVARAPPELTPPTPGYGACADGDDCVACYRECGGATPNDGDPTRRQPQPAQTPRTMQRSSSSRRAGALRRGGSQRVQPTRSGSAANFCAAPLAYLAGSNDRDCKAWLVLILCVLSCLGMMVVLVCLWTGSAEPGWLELLLACLFCLNVVWLYAMITQAATIRDYQRQNEALRAQVNGLADVNTGLRELSKEFGGNVRETHSFLVNLDNATTLNVKLAILNYFLVERGEKPGQLSEEQAQELFDQCLTTLWGENPEFDSSRDRMLAWLTQEGMNIDRVLEFAMRVARDSGQIGHPDGRPANPLTPAKSWRRRTSEERHSSDEEYADPLDRYR